MEDAIGLMQGAFERLASGEALNQPRRRLALPTGSTLHYMAAGRRPLLRRQNLLDAPALRRPLYTSCSTAPKMPSCSLSFRPTGWARSVPEPSSGLATRMMARADGDTVGLIGSGFQARSQLDAIAAVRRLRSVKVWSRSAEKRTLFAREASGQLGIPVEPAAGAEEAVRGAAIVVTMTNAREPVLEAAWIAPGTHVNAAGSNQPNRRELPPALVLRADWIVVDSIEQARMESGDLLMAMDEAAWNQPRVVELAQVVSGTRLHPYAGRRNHSLQIQRFSCRGCGERRVCLRARHRGRGRAGSAAGSFLSGHLLFDIAPGADLQAAADPAQRFGGNVRRLRAANRALHRLIDSVRGKGTLRLFQDFRRYYRFRPWLQFPSHCQPPEYDISMLNAQQVFPVLPGASRSAPCYARRTKRRRVFGSPWRHPESRSTAGNAGPG